MMKLTKWITTSLFLAFMISAAWGIDDAQIDRIARALASSIESAFPSFTGQVYSVREDEGIFINIGEKDGIKPGDRFEVYESGSQIVREDDGHISGYDGNRLALIEVEWIKEDYSLAKVIQEFSSTKIDYMDVLHYIQPERTIYIETFEGDFGSEISDRAKTYLRRVGWLNIIWNQQDAEYVASGRVFQRSKGIVDIQVHIKGSAGQTYKVENRFIIQKREKPQAVSGRGYRAYPFPEKPLDFMTSGSDELLILCDDGTVRLKFTPTGYEIISRDKLNMNRARPIREPIGRIGTYDLDGDNVSELLLGMVPCNESRYYNRVGSSYQIAGPLPGFPIDFTRSGHLLVGRLEEGYNVFSPTRANLITVTDEGSVSQITIWNIQGVFLDARIVDITHDGEIEIAVLYPDSTLSIINPFDHDTEPIARISGIGLGLYSDEPGGLYASSANNDEDKIYYMVYKDDELVKVAETEPVPYHIYRIGKHRGRIIALAYDDSENYWIIVFEDIK